jgi:hypothetical protein
MARFDPNEPERLELVQDILDGLRKATEAAKDTSGTRPAGKSRGRPDAFSLEQLGIPLDRIVRLLLIVHRIRGLRTDQTRDISQTLSELEPLIKELRKLIGDELTPVLNQFKGRTVESLDDKRAISRSINALLDDVGLRVKCPKTERPARLLARTGKGAEEGQFQLEVKGIKTCTSSSKDFPSIELTLAEPDMRYDRGRAKTGRQRTKRHENITQH